jgi:hypothetical protein
VLLWIFMTRIPSVQHNVAGVCIGISGSSAALGNDTHMPPIDERSGITSGARDQPLARSLPPFWVLFCPGLGYYCADGEAPKAAVFLGSDFQREFESISLQRRVHCEPDFQQPTTFKLKATTSAARRNHPGRPRVIVQNRQQPARLRQIADEIDRQTHQAVSGEHGDLEHRSAVAAIARGSLSVPAKPHGVRLPLRSPMPSPMQPG